MTEMRDYLRRQLERKVNRHGLVIWEDPEREYTGVWSSVVPAGVRGETFDGSWYDLRRNIEAMVAADTPPQLIVYVPASAPREDPLEEVRRAGAKFTRRLATLVAEALGKRLSPARISEIGREAKTLEQAEKAAAGAGTTDVRLVGVLRSTDPAGMLAEVLAGESDERIDASGAWTAVADVAGHTVGARGLLQIDAPSGQLFPAEGDRQISAGHVGSPEALRLNLFQHLVLCDLAQSIQGHLPAVLASAWQAPSKDQRLRASEVLNRLVGSSAGLAAYLRLATETDARLALDTSLDWQPGLEEAAGTPAVERVVLDHVAEMLAKGLHEEAARITRERLRRIPPVSDPSSDWGSRWRAALAVARLRAEIADGELPDTADSGGLLDWYADRGWRVDRAHRRLELTRTELTTFGSLEDALTAARDAYDRWLEALLDRFVASVEGGVLETGELLRQGDVHDRFVGPASGRTAYVLVDALRFELGRELADALSEVTDRVELHAAVAAVPTITQVGMANLMPGAAAGLRIALDGDRMRVSVGGVEVATVADRCDLLRARHGNVANLDLNQASQQGEQALGKALGDADLVLVRSQEVDAAGESGMLSVAWTDFESVVNLLAGVVARLAQCGVDRVVVSADHGFIALSQVLGSERIVDAPAGAVGTTKRRVFVGRGGTPNPATARVPLSSCGIPGDLDLVVPRGLAVFRAGGGLQFFHGGLSPQELVVPVIVAELSPAPAPAAQRVTVAVAGGRITTGVFAASLSFEGDLFASEVTVRVVAGDGSGTPVARIVSGDGYDPDTGAVVVESSQSRVLTFQVTQNLGTDTEVELQVLDAQTGRMLASSSAQVAAPVVVEDRLD